MRFRSIVTNGLIAGFMLVTINPVFAGEVRASITGIYDFSGAGPYKAADFSSPLLDFQQVALPSKIEIVDAGTNSVGVKFVRQDGTAVEKVVDLRHSGFVRKNGAIEYEIAIPDVGAKILPGKTIQTKTLTFRNDKQGNLQIVRNIVEKGFMLFLIPFSDNHESTLTLRRAGDIPATS